MEFKRILLSKSFIFLLIALLIISAYFFVYKSTSSGVDMLYRGRVYDELIREYSAYTPEEGIEKCEEYEDNAVEQMIEGTWERTPEASLRLELVKQIRDQLSHLAGYNEYVIGIQKNAERLQSISLFSDKNSFSYKNTVKTARDFADLRSVEVTLCHDLAVTEVFSDKWTDIISLIPIFLVCGLFLAERKNKMDALVYAAPNGRGRLAAKRVCILLIASFITVVILFGSKILLNAVLYNGLDEWGRSLQSISVFYNVPYKMTIGEFWIWFLMIKTLGVFLIGLIAWLIETVFSSISAAIGVLFIIAGVEYGLTFIPLSSLFAPLRYINIFTYIDYFPVFRRYLNLNMLGAAVSGNEAACSVLFALCTVLLICAATVAIKRRPVREGEGRSLFLDNFRKKLDALLSGGTLFVKEAKKLLVYKKGLVVLIIMLVLLMHLDAPIRDELPIDMYLDHYKEKYEGPINEEVIESLRDELDAANETERIAAIKLLISQCSIARKGSWIVPSAPYEALFEVQAYHYTVALSALLFLILLVSPMLAEEREAGVTTLVRSTRKGRLTLWATKHLLLFSLAFLVWLTVYGIEIKNITDAYGDFSSLSAPLSSLVFLPFNVWDISVGEMMVFVYGMRLLTLLTAAEICALLSQMCARSSGAIIINISVLLLPAALAAIGSSIGERISLLMPLTVIGAGPTLLPYALLLIVFAIALSMSAYIFIIRKKG